MSLPDGWFRERPDSSTLSSPRLLARRFVHPDDLDDQIAFYERVLGARCDSRTPIPEAGLELSTVGNLLLIGNPNPPGEAARATAFTLLVASVVDYVADLEGTGTELTEPISTEPSGSRTRVRYPDRTLVEVIDSRPLSDE
jgi:catechol 2,3-dioxygenase-like lactoylglutathione lyase family enzyme